MNILNIKKIVKDKYRGLARQKTGCCSCGSKSSRAIAEEIGYSQEELIQVGEANLGLGCGNPVAMSKIKAGDTVVDLGSGAGIDCLLASKKVGPHGKVIGVDMTEEMIERARANAQKASADNVEFVLADIENLPLEDNSADVVISNCVINLAPDKDKVLKEVHRILKTGGRMYVSDIVLLEELSAGQRQDEELISCCVGGALLKDDYLAKLNQAGFEVKILSENKSISKSQYRGINLESLMIEAKK
jgi:ArsR family transcriptional regulator